MGTVMGSGTDLLFSLPKVYVPPHWPRFKTFRRFEEDHGGAFLGVMPRAFRRLAATSVPSPWSMTSETASRTVCASCSSISR